MTALRGFANWMARFAATGPIRGSVVVAVTLAAMIAHTAFAEPTPEAPKEQEEGGGEEVVPTLREADWVEILSGLVSVEFETFLLKDFIDYIQETFGFVSVVDPTAQAALARAVPYINTQELSVGATLEIVLKEFGLICVPTQKGLWIGVSSAQPAPALGAFSKDVLAASLLPKKEVREKLVKALAQEVDCDFKDLSVETIIPYLSNACKVNFVLDPRVVSFDMSLPGNKKARAVDWPGEKKGGSVKRLAYHGSLWNAIERLLLPVGLDYSIEEGYVWISTPEILQKEARWYKPHTGTLGTVISPA